ncbi:phosphoribosyltransferase [Candidatus Uhrbacteria bacterium]|nr:phosphoribosyltransferase [Candidatus Uhrbacteria bacterium]
MPFKNREEAGMRLAEKLLAYKDNPYVTVIALPRGGVVLGRKIADALHAPLDIVVPRKLGAPDNEEYAIGALTEDGGVVWNELEKKRYGDEILAIIVKRERKEALRRLSIYRKGLPSRVLKNKIVVLVDDGVATGYTIRSAIKTIEIEQPEKIIAALPGGPEDTISLLKKEVDEVIVLEIPQFFAAVGQLYEDFPQVTDSQVIALLGKWGLAQFPKEFVPDPISPL